MSASVIMQNTENYKPYSFRSIR